MIKNDLITGIALTLLGIVVMALPIFEVSNFKLVFQIILVFYAISNLTRYTFNKNKKDIEGLLTFIASLILFFITLINFQKNNLTMALILFAFVIFISFIKLKKADFYHDSLNKMWILEIISLIIFVIIGFINACYILLSINHIAILGELLIFNGFLELIDPIVKYIKKSC